MFFDTFSVFKLCYLHSYINITHKYILFHIISSILLDFLKIARARAGPGPRGSGQGQLRLALALEGQGQGQQKSAGPGPAQPLDSVVSILQKWSICITNYPDSQDFGDG